jgi:hypothetical protein
LASILEPIARSPPGGGPDPGQPGVDHRAGEVGVLGQEAVAGVDGVGARRAGGLDQQVAAQVGLGGRVARAAARRVGLATCGASASASENTATVAMPSVAAGAEDAAGDLAAVGDQQDRI